MHNVKAIRRRWLTGPQIQSIMSLRSRVTSTWKLLPVPRLCMLAAFPILLSWYFAYRRTVSFLDSSGGIGVEQLGRANILYQTLDSSVIAIGVLVFAASGLIPIGILLAGPDERRSQIAQLIWAASILVMYYVA